MSKFMMGGGTDRVQSLVDLLERLPASALQQGEPIPAELAAVLLAMRAEATGRALQDGRDMIVIGTTDAIAGQKGNYGDAVGWQQGRDPLRQESGGSVVGGTAASPYRDGGSPSIGRGSSLSDMAVDPDSPWGRGKR